MSMPDLYVDVRFINGDARFINGDAIFTNVGAR